jgi:hypothetical protein
VLAGTVTGVLGALVHHPSAPKPIALAPISLQANLTPEAFRSLTADVSLAGRRLRIERPSPVVRALHLQDGDVILSVEPRGDGARVDLVRDGRPVELDLRVVSGRASTARWSFDPRHRRLVRARPGVRPPAGPEGPAPRAGGPPGGQAA